MTVNNIKKLIDYCIKMPEKEEYEKGHKYPYYSCEVLCSMNGLNLDNISIYPHINTNCDVLPDEIINDDEVYQKSDLIYVAKEYGDFYLLQDYLKEDGTFDLEAWKNYFDTDSLKAGNYICGYKN